MTTIEQLRQAFSTLTFLENEPLAKHTTVKIGGPAEIFCLITDRQDLTDLVLYANTHSIPVTVLGWGANTLIADAGIKGLVIKNAAQGITIHDEDRTKQAVAQFDQLKFDPRWQASAAPEAPSHEFADLDYDESAAERVLVTMDAGVSLPSAINTLAAKGITGLQWYTRIPATIGGALYNNIHGGTHFIGEVVSSVEIISENNELRTLTVDQLDLAYDFSRFHHTHEVILSVNFLLYKGDVQKAQQTAVEWAKRKAVQPQNTLGCVFQNLSEDEQRQLKLPTPSIGYLIQHVLKLKGYQVGDAKISERHAAFIENVGHATAADYLAVIRKITSETKDKCGINLKTEIFFLGFTDEELAGIVHSRSTKGTLS